MQGETQEIYGHITDSTDHAWLIRHKDGKECWFPKDDVEFTRRNMRTGACAAVVSITQLEIEGWPE